MRDVELEWFHLTFNRAFFSERGTAFQDFFSRIMEAAYLGEFERVRPYGSKGDLKCDGFLPSEGLVFQVYGPREMKEAEVLKKVKRDFAGAKRHWKKEMKGWVFVHNDPDGLSAGVTKLLDAIRTKNEGLRIEPWGYSSLHDVTMKIRRDKLVTLFGRPPSRQDFDRLGFPLLARVLATIRGDLPTDTLAEIKPVSPEKLEANALSTAAVDYLKLGRHREAFVQRYFDKHPNPTFGEEVATVFRQEYIRLREDGLSPDAIFAGLQEFAAGSTRGEAGDEASVLAVLSYLFERCDIFEAPTEAAP